jgi:outer membrane immunogenic protein
MIGGQLMKNRLLKGLAVLALTASGAVQAADLKSHAVAPPLMAPSWTGFYAGLGLGARASRGDLTTTSETLGTSVSLAGAANLSDQINGSAFRVSPYLGFNWQFAPQWVAGIEGDVGFANKTTTLGGFPFTPAFGTFNDPADSLAAKMTWDASLRGRLGFLVAPALLAYATGGVAWQHYEFISTCAGATCVAAGFTPAVVTNSSTKPGWTLGGGLEAELWGRWLARLEYRYADFGTASFSIVRSSADASHSPAGNTFDFAARTHTLNFGLAYKFN